MNIILKKPHITEKTMKMAQEGLYTFIVSKSATKPQIAKVVAEKFDVKVISVKTVNIKGQIKMQRKVRAYYETSGIKKAMVQVAKGQTIALFEAPKEEAEVISAGEMEPVIKEKKSFLRDTKVKIEKGTNVPTTPTQRKVITGK